MLFETYTICTRSSSLEDKNVCSCLFSGIVGSGRFTTIANFQNGVVRVKSAAVKKSQLAVDDIKDGIAKNDPMFANTLQRLGKDIFDVYEAHFGKAYITVFSAKSAQENVEVNL